MAGSCRGWPSTMMVGRRRWSCSQAPRRCVSSAWASSHVCSSPRRLFSCRGARQAWGTGWGRGMGGVGARQGGAGQGGARPAAGEQGRAGADGVGLLFLCGCSLLIRRPASRPGPRSCRPPASPQAHTCTTHTRGAHPRQPVAQVLQPGGVVVSVDAVLLGHGAHVEAKHGCGEGAGWEGGREARGG